MTSLRRPIGAVVDAALTGEINQNFIDSFRAVPNTLDGILTYQDLENFLGATLISQWQTGRLEPTAKKEASQFYFALSGTSWGLARYGGQFSLDETDLYNSVSVDLAAVTVKEAAKAAARLLPDLVYSLLLLNPTVMADGLPLFSAQHNNYATGPSSSLLYQAFTVSGSGSDTIVDTPGALSAALAVIGSQTMTDQDGRPVHLGLSPTILVCSPAVYSAGRQMARLLRNEDGRDLEVRMESRLSSSGVVDPATGNLVSSGSNLSWLLASPGKLAASIVVGGLTGEGLEPAVRVTDLAGPGPYAGMWGKNIDVKLDLAAAVIDFRSLYFGLGQ